MFQRRQKNGAHQSMQPCHNWRFCHSCRTMKSKYLDNFIQLRFGAGLGVIRMRNHFLSTKLGFIATILILPQAFLLAHWSNKVEGVANTKGRNYACALISNGSISTQIDNLGVQKQTRYVSFYPCVAWEGAITAFRTIP